MSWTKWNGKAVENAFRKEMSDAVKDAVEVVAGVSLQQVPHQDGDLQGSLFIQKDPNDSLKTWIGYGGGGVTGRPIVPYALWHHENPANFQKGRKHNYLRDPIKTHLPKEMKVEFVKRGLK